MSGYASTRVFNSPAKTRTSLFDRDLLYLFSYDADLEMRRDEIGFVPGGFRINVIAKPNKTRIYHVARERSTLGFQSVQGTVSWGSDRALLRNDNVGVLDVQLTMRTDDGELIYSTYKGIYPTGPRGYRQLISKKPVMGTEKNPFSAPVYVTPRYETRSPKYRWLMQYQCIGFGRVEIVKSTVRNVTFDIYAMD